MDARWFKQFKAESADERRQCEITVRAAAHVLDELSAILEREKQSLERTTKEDYDCPSWAYRQAHVNGQVESLNKVIHLITIEGKK